MRKYESIIVLRADLDEEKRTAVLDRFYEIIRKEGHISNIDEWGLKKLAYEIEKQKEGYYVLLEYEADSKLPKELERNLKISDFVLRYITISSDEKA